MKAPQGRVMSGPHKMFFDYLENRYASTIVLTFGQIEDLLGSTLPAEALVDDKWWTEAEVDLGEPRRSDCWLLARRSATPNIGARIVRFTREL